MSKFRSFIAIVFALAFADTATADEGAWGIKLNCENAAGTAAAKLEVVWNKGPQPLEGDCMFNDGKTVRIRFGYTPNHIGPFQPKVSVWVDKRRLLSEVTVDTLGRTWGFDKVSCFKPVEDCHLKVMIDRKLASVCIGEAPDTPICETTPINDASKPIDEEEYSDETGVVQEPGRVKILHSEDDLLCQRFVPESNVLQEAKWLDTSSLQSPLFMYTNEYKVNGPGHMEKLTIDINNDGGEEVVYKYEERSRYRQQDIYFYNVKTNSLSVGSSLIDFVVSSRSIFPCLISEKCLEDKRSDIDPFYSDDSLIPLNNVDEIDEFTPRTRYTQSEVLTLNGTTYILITTTDGALANKAVLLKLHENSHSVQCYFEKVLPNF